MQLSLILPHLIYKFINENELIRSIEEISIKFTQKRENINDYLNDSRLVSAYAVFYLTTNIGKLNSVLNWLPAEFIDKMKSTHILDMGAGPGTYSIALRELLQNPILISQIETSLLMREQAKKIWDGLYPGEKLIQNPNLNDFKSKETFLLFGHSANEMGFDRVVDYFHKIDPDHILFIEPGTKSVFELMLKLRRFLIQMNYELIYPCPNNEQCPLSGTNDWCHQYIEIKHDFEVERISQIVRKDRRNLPLTVMAFSKNVSAHRAEIRIIRTLPMTKFSFEWEACINNQKVSIQVMKRSLSKQQLEKLEKVSSGDEVEITLEKELEKCQRVKVLKINNLLL